MCKIVIHVYIYIYWLYSIHLCVCIYIYINIYIKYLYKLGGAVLWQSLAWQDFFVFGVFVKYWCFKCGWMRDWRVAWPASVTVNVISMYIINVPEEPTRCSSDNLKRQFEDRIQWQKAFHWVSPIFCLYLSQAVTLKLFSLPLFTGPHLPQ